MTKVKVLETTLKRTSFGNAATYFWSVALSVKRLLHNGMTHKSHSTLKDKFHETCPGVTPFSRQNRRDLIVFVPRDHA